ncbi:MAG: cytochrome c3 family protein [Methylotenera sp.]|nr:cytochrome c3 family protein [Oligoflexia bacterium]
MIEPNTNRKLLYGCASMNRSDSGRFKKIGILVGVVLLLGLGGAVAAVFPSASNEGYSPEQPIPYSHKLHAGTYKIQCQYCHSDVEKSKHANVPSVNVCMNCHSIVKTDSPYIQKIKKAYDENKPIEWVRIHELPDFVYFPHKRHVAKGVACQTCHGPIQEMERVYQYSPLTMGWCLDCHRGKTTPKEVVARVYPGVKDPKGLIAPHQCTTCHQ